MPLIDLHRVAPLLNPIAIYKQVADKRGTIWMFLTTLGDKGLKLVNPQLSSYESPSLSRVRSRPLVL